MARRQASADTPLATFHDDAKWRRRLAVALRENLRNWQLREDGVKWRWCLAVALELEELAAAGREDGGHAPALNGNLLVGPEISSLRAGKAVGGEVEG